MRRRTRFVLLAGGLAAAAVIVMAFLLRPAPEPRGQALQFVETNAEKSELRQALREGRVTLVKPDELVTMLSPEQRALLERRGASPQRATSTPRPGSGR